VRDARRSERARGFRQSHDACDDKRQRWGDGPFPGLVQTVAVSRSVFPPYAHKELVDVNKKHDLWHWRRAGWLQRGHLLQALRTQGRGLMTGLLLTCIFLLLIGIAMQLPPPAPPAPPDSFTTVPYSTLIQQVRAGQVMAANIQGNVLNALLVPGRRGTLVAGVARKDAAFGDCLPEDVAGCSDEEGQPYFSRTQVLFTRAPEQELPRLLALLLSKHIVVRIAREYAPPPWVPLLWRVAPLWVLLLLLLATDTTEDWKW
jgi:hypothetical protein